VFPHLRVGLRLEYVHAPAHAETKLVMGPLWVVAVVGILEGVEPPTLRDHHFHEGPLPFGEDGVARWLAMVPPERANHAADRHAADEARICDHQVGGAQQDTDEGDPPRYAHADRDALTGATGPNGAV
jgi:hypothetical protein